MIKKTLLQLRQRRPDYRDAGIKRNVRKVALDLLSHLGFIENPWLYTLLTTGWPEVELGGKLGVRNPQQDVSRYRLNPGNMPYRYHFRIIATLAAYLNENDSGTETQMRIPGAVQVRKGVTDQRELGLHLCRLKPYFRSARGSDSKPRYPPESPVGSMRRMQSAMG